MVDQIKEVGKVSIIDRIKGVEQIKCPKCSHVCHWGPYKWDCSMASLECPSCKVYVSMWKWKHRKGNFRSWASYEPEWREALGVKPW